MKDILTYRPDVFNTADFLPACVPTIYVTMGRRSRRSASHNLNAF